MELSKTCTICEVSKPATLANFRAHQSGLHGLHSICRPCCNAAAIAKRLAETPAERERRREKAKIKARAHRKASPGRRPAVSEKAKAYRLTASKTQYWKDPDRSRALARDQAAKNRPAVVERTRKWRKANPAKQKVLEARNRTTRRSNPQVRLHESIGLQIWFALKGRKNGRSWQAIVGYTIADLVKHLERQFLPGMTWENYGPVWHVDHIIPKALFSFETAADEGFRACWAITNLRPLWAVDNLRKHARRELLI